MRCLTVQLSSCLLLMVVVTSASWGDALQRERYSPTKGEMHADFALPRVVDGTPLRLSDFRGKKLLLLHFASW